jgi:chemotaxis regulatin CheY-phosphate phosphatase CheZ
MSEETRANKSQPPPALPDAEYDAIYATVSETAQGRRFLEEYARRCHPSDTEASLAAIERMQAAVRADDASGRLDLLLEMADMAQTIARVRAEITALEMPPGSGPQDAMGELDAIVHMTESATSRILAAAELMQEIAWTLRESGANNALCEHLDAQATEIYTACSFQDLTGQRTRKVIEVLRYLEERINAAVTPRDAAPSDAPTVHDPSGRLVQADVDAMMQPSAENDRQDATLEDISRLMLAIEPLILQATAEEQAKHAKQSEADTRTPAVGDVRPELSVAERVMAEGNNPLPMAEWTVEPKPPTAPTQDAEASAKGAVEDPSAPQPGSELPRTETELDEPEAERETSTETAAFVPSPPIPPIPAIPATAEVFPANAPRPLMAEPVIPSRPPAVEPGLFVAESMAQLATTLRPASLLPPPELVFRTKLPAPDPIAELRTAMQAMEMKLLQPDDDAGVPQASKAEATSELMQHAAAVVTEPCADTVPVEETLLSAASELDDFLFAKAAELQRPDEAETEPLGMIEETAQAAEPKEVMTAEFETAFGAESESGNYPNLVLVTPETLEEPKVEAAQSQSAPPSDPLARLRALSETQKIALFS